MANRESVTVADNVLHGGKTEVDFDTVPHAVYSHPQIAAVGESEKHLNARDK